jgi:hypothetical protein
VNVTFIKLYFMIIWNSGGESTCLYVWVCTWNCCKYKYAATVCCQDKCFARKFTQAKQEGPYTHDTKNT